MTELEKKALKLYPRDYRVVMYDGFDHTGENLDDYTEDLNEFPRRAWIKGYKASREDLGAKWHSVAERPTEPGIYVVAQFDGDNMLAYDTNWAFCDGYFGPNNLGWQDTIKPTHWMSKAEYGKALEGIPRE